MISKTKIFSENNLFNVKSISAVDEIQLLKSRQITYCNLLVKLLVKSSLNC